MDLVRQAVERWVGTLAWKGLAIVESAGEQGRWVVAHQDDLEEVGLELLGGQPVLTVSRVAGDEVDRFDLGAMSCTGTGSPISEDLRDWLRRSGMKISSAKRPYRSLQPVLLRELEELDRQLRAPNG